MIRRRAEGEFRLIAQSDHAALAGELAGVFGNAVYQRPDDRPRLARAVALHDAGWPIHDESPAPGTAGLPPDVFEADTQLACRCWEASAAAAEAVDPYAGLLVSIHVHRLAAHAARQRPGEPPMTNRRRFWLIEFCNDQSQRQILLRDKLALRSDRPLDAGLPIPNGPGADDPPEQVLAYHVRILQTCDLLSLCVCCDDPPAWTSGPLPRRPGGASLPLRVERPTGGRLVVQPWPFDAATVVLDVPYRPVPLRHYDDAADLARALAAAPRRMFQVVVEPPRGRL